MPSDGRRGLRISLPLVVLAATTLWGCGSFRLYDESRAKQAAGIKERYAKAEVLGTLDVEKKNLDNLLAEELKVVRDNQRLRVDFALLRVADDTTPMADTYVGKAQKRIDDLGFASFKALRQARHAAIDLAVGNQEIQGLVRRIRSLAKTPPPPCEPGVPLPETMDLSQATDRASVEGQYARYRNACNKLAETKDSGRIQEAKADWMQAHGDVAMLDQSVQDAQKVVTARSKAHDDALAEQKNAAAAAAKTTEALQRKADAARKALEKAKDIAKVVEVRDSATKRVDALVTVLTAAAGGTVTPEDENLKKAATVAKEIPSLAGDMEALMKQRKVPSVNNLLIEMRHQTLLLDHAKQLQTFAQERADILKAHYDALQEEARLWLRFSDAVCSYAVVKSRQAFPGPACDTFVVTAATPATATEPAKPATCKIGQDLAPCPLDKPWNESIQDRSNAVATREIYKALVAYLQVLAIQGTEHEHAFRLIDVTHREALAGRASALKEWDNLVAVPVSQLDAYYQAGLKPAEIADLLVKALGFTAIAVGVSR
jgi:hypothetical protein